MKAHIITKNLTKKIVPASVAEYIRMFTTSFKEWPQATIESKGDYRDERYLEDVIGGKLYEAQKKLPRLPVPSIERTIAKFLPTALPLSESKEESVALEKACKRFPAQASILQQRLLDRKEKKMKDSSWLQLWWNTVGYLQVRDPVVVNVSYFFHFADDPSIHNSTTPTGEEAGNAARVTSSLGVRRGASILFSTAQFRKKVCSGDLSYQKIGKKETPLCSVAFKYMFNACRIPRKNEDSYKLYDPSKHQHCIVVCKGMFFAVDFVDDNGDPFSVNILQDRLQQCVDMARRQEEEEEEEGAAPRLGWLTSHNRDSWADARVELLRVGGSEMETALETLESGAILLCIDDEEPMSRKQCGEIFWTGGLSSGHNRWFDKSIQIMCTANGKAGLIGEHSMMDGMPMLQYVNFITAQTYTDAQKMKGSACSPSSNGGVQNIFQHCISSIKSGDSQIGIMIDEAKSAFQSLVGAHSLQVQSFQGYGSNYIKKIGYSPDAYVQMAIQLATYRLFKKQVGTYEATQMRPFLHGRTETTRSVSPDSEAFVKAMGFIPRFNNNPTTREEKLSLLRSAVDSHMKYIRDAAVGNGIDRHFLGLSMLVEGEEEMPELYKNPVFTRSKTWRVSTSNLTHPKIENWGFGEVVYNGVGVGYSVKSESCIFNITAQKEHEWTDRLSYLLEEALIEMRLLNDTNQLPSKL